MNQLEKIGPQAVTVLNYNNNTRLNHYSIYIPKLDL